MNARRPLLVALAALLAPAACSGRPAAPPAPPPPAPAAAPPPAVTPPPAPAAEIASLDALAAAAPPLMREAARSDALEGGLAVRADTDTCFRAAVAASAPFRAWFEDETHGPRAPWTSTTWIPADGPVCARRGETLRLVVTGSTVAADVDAFPSVARAVVWRSP